MLTQHVACAGSELYAIKDWLSWENVEELKRVNATDLIIASTHVCRAMRATSAYAK